MVNGGKIIAIVNGVIRWIDIVQVQNCFLFCTCRCLTFS